MADLGLGLEVMDMRQWEYNIMDVHVKWKGFRQLFVSECYEIQS